MLNAGHALINLGLHMKMLAPDNLPSMVKLPFKKSLISFFLQDFSLYVIFLSLLKASFIVQLFRYDELSLFYLLRLVEARPVPFKAFR